MVMWVENFLGYILLVLGVYRTLMLSFVVVVVFVVLVCG